MKMQKSNLLTLLVIAIASSLVTLLMVSGPSTVAAHPQEYTGSTNHLITLDQALKYVQNFRTSDAASAIVIKGAYFDRGIFDKILAQPGCVGVRYYYAKKDDGTQSIVLVGVDSKNQDLTSGILGEDAVPCPPFCAPSSPLN